MIKINGLHKYYNKGKKNEEHVLKDINLTFEKTGLVCILGESGSGKTTLLNTIGGLDTFSEGYIQINNTKLDRYEPKKVEPIRNEHFDYVFQNYYLLKDHTVAYNVKLALNRFELTEEEKEKRVTYVLERLGMAKYRKKIVSKLSGGQQQRVSIARALVKSPDVIFADEPTGNLDEENTLRTMSILKSISKECLVLLVTHEKRIADFFADRIIEIRDGKVYRDEKNDRAGAYERSDDANIYLKELTCKAINEENLDVKIYGEDACKIKLNFAWKDGKLYIQKDMSADIVLEGVESGVHMVDAKRPKLDMEEVEKFSYDLPKLKSKGKAVLTFKEIWRLAIENIRIMGRKQAFVMGILLVTAVLLTITLAEFINTVSVDEASVVKTDSHYVQVEFTKVSSLRAPEQQLEILEFAEAYMTDDRYGKVFVVPDSSLFLVGEGFAQMTNLLQRVSNFSYAPLELVEEESLLYGRMPQKRNEVVLDIRVAEQIMDAKGVISSLYDSVENLIGAKLTVASSTENMEIVGICDTNEPDIYCVQNLLLGMSAKGYAIASYEELQQEYPEEIFEALTEENEILIREGLYQAYQVAENGRSIQLGEDDKRTYEVVGSFPDEMGVDYVMTEEGCHNVRNLMIYEMKKFLIYTENKDETITYFKECGETYSSAFRVETDIPYEAELLAYEKAHAVNVDAKMLIATLLVGISLVMVYFTVKSNAVSRSEELTVYRLIGISKGSILRVYVLEMLLVTALTSLPAVLVSSSVIKLISAIPSLEIGLLLPWWAILVLLLLIFMTHSIISVLPVYGILSKPPATLAVKE